MFAAAMLTWLLIKVTLGMRVKLREEIEGLDIGEHGNQAYPEFVIRRPSIMAELTTPKKLEK